MLEKRSALMVKIVPISLAARLTDDVIYSLRTFIVFEQRATLDVEQTASSGPLSQAEMKLDVRMDRPDLRDGHRASQGGTSGFG